MEGNLHFKIDWASLIAGRKFTVFALSVCLCINAGDFQVQAPGGAYIWRGDLKEGFCITSLGGLYLEGLIHCPWRGSFSQFYGITRSLAVLLCRYITISHRSGGG